MLFRKIKRKLVNYSRYITLRKLFNRILISIQKNLKISHVYGYPPVLIIEPTNICDSNCKLCPVGQRYSFLPKGKMSFGNYKKIIDQLKDYLIGVSLSGWGEPFLNKDLYKMIDYAHKNKIHTCFSTNFHKFNPKDTKKLVLSGLDSINVSLHGLSQSSYGWYQPGYNLNEILIKIKTLVSTKSMLNSDTPEIIVNNIVTKYNENELKFIKNFAKKLGISYHLESMSLNLRFLNRSDKRFDKWQRKRLSWLPKNEKYIRKPYLTLLEGKNLKNKMVKCDWPWKKVFVNWNGDITACCGVYDKQYVIGNILKQPFSNIWNNTFYKACRLSFKNFNKENKLINRVCCYNCPGVMV